MCNIILYIILVFNSANSLAVTNFCSSTLFETFCCFCKKKGKLLSSLTSCALTGCIANHIIVWTYCTAQLEAVITVYNHCLCTLLLLIFVSSFSLVYIKYIVPVANLSHSLFGFWSLKQQQKLAACLSKS